VALGVAHHEVFGAEATIALFVALLAGFTFCCSFVPPASSRGTDS